MKKTALVILAIGTIILSSCGTNHKCEAYNTGGKSSVKTK